MDNKSISCMLVGYDSESKPYRVCCPKRKKIITTRNVVIDESRIGFHELKIAQTREDKFF